MPGIMTPTKKPFKSKQLKKDLLKEMNFLKNIFLIMPLPLHRKGEENEDFEMTMNSKQNEEKELPKRAQSIAELENKLQKIKSQTSFNLKNKLAKKSLTSKLSKKIKKRDRVMTNKTRAKGEISEGADGEENSKVTKQSVNIAKPIYNTEGKLVFSKFDFAKVGKADKKPKAKKDPKQLLENIKQQEQKFQQLAETGDADRVKEIKEKMLWKNTLQKAEGQKIKDDPILLKKSIKRQEQKKKASQKKWDTRIKNVEQKKDDRQKKRKENIMNKKKEKKTKVQKASAKRGRVVI